MVYPFVNQEHGAKTFWDDQEDSQSQEDEKRTVLASLESIEKIVNEVERVKFQPASFQERDERKRSRHQEHNR